MVFVGWSSGTVSKCTNASKDTTDGPDGASACMAQLDLLPGNPPKLPAAAQGQNQSLRSSRLPLPMSQPNRRCSAFNLQEASFPWQQYFGGIFGSLPPEGPCACDARAARSALAPGLSCRQARNAPHCRAGDELPARRGHGENPERLWGAVPALGGGERGEKHSPKGMKDAWRQLSQ